MELSAHALLQEALRLHRQGAVDEAVRGYQQVLRSDPANAEAHYYLAIVFYQRNKVDDAIALAEKALALNQADARVLRLLGQAQNRIGQRTKALESLDRAIACAPDMAEAHGARADVLVDLGRTVEAIASYDRALAIQPASIGDLCNRGAALGDLGRHDEAIDSYDKVIALKPDFAEAYFNRGGAFAKLARYEEALANYDQALAIRPNYAEALSDRGNTLSKLRRFAEAVTSFDTALSIDPNNAEAHLNRGNTLKELKRIDEALASFDRALGVRPDYADANLNVALTRLLTGDFALGWEKYEWRWKCPPLASVFREFAQPQWHGQNALAGRTILLHAEQGLGDTIQFSRYAPLVAERGARVILEVQEPLKDLMKGLSGGAHVVSKGDPLPAFDLHCPLLSLPSAFGTRLETIPTSTPYLQTPKSRLNSWDALLGPKTRPRIGLAWSGNAVHPNDRNRSITLRTLLPLLDCEAMFVSLQKDIRADDAALFDDRREILRFGDLLKDFSDTAALMSHLDLVISVDTSVAHLAGALAKPVWILLPFVPDWRWLLDRADSPWYPTARLFRQDGTHAWDGVIARVREALLEFVKTPDARSHRPL